MKIAFLSYAFGEYCLRQANALAHQAEILLLLTQSLAENQIVAIDSALKYQPFEPPRLRQPIRQLFCTRSLLENICAFEPDVIHFQAGHLWFNLLGLPRLRRYPLVLTIHNPRHHPGDRASRKTPQWIMDRGYRCADQVIVHGQSIKEEVIRELGISEDRIHVVPHVEMGGGAKLSNTQEAGNEILFFGRIWAYKGLDYLIRAEPLITAKVPDAKIVIAGEGEDFDRYRRLMQRPDRFIVYNEWISDEERAELFQRASVVVLPYIEATQSGVVPIAYTYNKPVVVTRTGALPEVVEHGKTGIIVEPRDEEALAEAIVQLLKDRELRCKMGAAGKAKLDAECSPAIVAKKTLEVYEVAMREKQKPNSH